jgi:uncharacterized protein YndB with AHSA1/START domain
MRVDEASHRISAAPEHVFGAFLDPDLFVSWLPPEGMSGRLERFDADGYRLVLTYLDPPTGGGKATADSDVADVRRVVVDPPHRLVEEVDFPSDDPAYAGTMTMTWTFVADGDGTLVTIAATEVPRGIDHDVHVGALTDSLRQLARAVERD